MINAGISGHTSAQGLARIDADVIAKKPDLVVVMFGMNDVCRADLDTFRANLREIIVRCRKAGAAVVLVLATGAARVRHGIDRHLRGLIFRVAELFAPATSTLPLLFVGSEGMPCVPLTPIFSSARS